MAKHRPAVVWPTKKVGVYPQVYIKTHDERHIDLSFFLADSGCGFGFVLDRRHARLLAKRINQCLDDTK